MFRQVVERDTGDEWSLKGKDERTPGTSQTQLPNTVLDDGPDQLKQDDDKERLEILSELRV